MHFSAPDVLKLFQKAIYLTGSISKLAAETQLATSTLRRIAKGNTKSTYATQYRLKEFVESNSNRAGRPFKKGNTNV